MTIKQSQYLLCYLGYAVGTDGIMGPQTQNAIRQFQKDYGVGVDGLWGPQTEKKILAVISDPKNNPKVEKPTVPPVVTPPTVNKPVTGTFWDNVKYFSRSEFKCKCNGKYCNGYPVEMSEKLIKVAERVREHFGKPINVTSGIRCKQHNANQGGVATSRHMYGRAMDFYINGVTATQILAYVQKQPEIAYSYAVNGNVVHMDVL